MLTVVSTPKWFVYPLCIGCICQNWFTQMSDHSWKIKKFCFASFFFYCGLCVSDRPSWAACSVLFMDYTLPPCWCNEVLAIFNKNYFGICGTRKLDMLKIVFSKFVIVMSLSTFTKFLMTLYLKRFVFADDIVVFPLVHGNCSNLWQNLHTFILAF